MIRFTKTATLGATLIGAALLAGCAYQPAPGPYGYDYSAATPNYSGGDGTDSYSYGYGPGYGYGPDYYGYGYEGGPAVYGYDNGGYYNQNRDWHRDHAENGDRRYDPNHPAAFNRDHAGNGDHRRDANHPAAFNRAAPAARPAEMGARTGNPTMLRPQSGDHSVARAPEGDVKARDRDNHY